MCWGTWNEGRPYYLGRVDSNTNLNNILYRGEGWPNDGVIPTHHLSARIGDNLWILNQTIGESQEGIKT